MPPRPPSSLLHYLRYATGLWRDDPRPDADLLAAFTASRDEAVFAVLVSRHGQAVWRTCAHVLGDTPEAEDAFQATFMLLARKPPALRRESLGGWLYRVAHRLALKARRAGSRRDQLLIGARSRAGREPEPPDELREVAHEELAALPERLRVPLALYYLEGKSQLDIARVMKLSDRAVRDRLARGLDVLRERMADRGMTVSAVAAAAALGPSAVAQAIPARLLADTASAATRFAVNPAAAAGPAADLAARLLAPRLSMWPAVVVAVLVGLAGAAAVAAFTAGPPPAPPLAVAEPATEPSPVPAVAPAPRPVTRTFRHDGTVTAVTVSPDGRHVASAGTDHAVRVWDAETGRQVARFDAPPEGVAALTFSPDGSALVVDDPKTGLAVWNLAGGARRHTLIGQAAGVSALAFSPDGNTLVTVGRDGQLLSLNLARPQGTRLDRDLVLTERVTKLWTRHRSDPPQPPGGPVALRVGADYAVAFAADGSSYCAADRRLVVTRFRAAPGPVEQMAVVNPKEVPARTDVVLPISTVALSPGAGRMAWGNGDHRIGLADLTRPGTVARPAPTIQLLRGHAAGVIALAFSPDGNTLASSDIAGGVIRWTLPGPGVPFEMLASRAPFRTVVLAFSPDGKRLYGGGERGEVWCRNPATFELIGPLPGGNMSEGLR